MEELQYCEICGSELDEAGICHNTMCINSPDYEPQFCPDCGGILEDGICHNAACPSSPDYVNPDDPWRDPMMDDPWVEEPMEQTCPNCGSLLGDDGLCHNTSCSDSPDYIPEVESIDYYGLVLRAIEQTQIGISDASTNNNVYYSFDGEDWDLLGDGITLEEGQEMALKCTGKCYRTITMNGGKVKAFGDLASMFYERAGRIDASGEHNAFMELFANCTALYDVSELYLDVYTNSRDTYFLLYKMFYGCTNIEQAPVINFECNTQYGNGSFQYVFKGCTSLKSAKSIKLTGNCRDYQMGEAFYGCENLEESPLIFWKIMNGGCMGFDKAFYGCSKLKKIYTDISVYYPQAAQNWVYGVAPTGTFYKLGTADIPTGKNGIPQGWAVKYTMDELIVTPTALSFKPIGVTKTVDVDAEYEWGATTDADWISLQKKAKDTSYAIFDGQSYFNTGYAPRNTHNLKFEVTYDGGYYCLFGREEGGDINESLCFFDAGAGSGRRDYTIRCGNMIGYETEIGRVGLWSGKMTVNEPLPVKGGKYKVTYAVDSSANRAYFEQYNENTNTTEVKATAILNALADSDLTIYIGWSNRRGGSPDPKYNGTIYNIKFWEDDTLLHEYVFRDVDGVGKMYDKVTNQYFDNLGSGSITVGGSAGSFNMLDITTSENTGDERRADVLIEDTEGNQKTVAVRQKSAYAIGHPLFIGGQEIASVYLGNIQITSAFIGDVEVFVSE